MTLNIFSFQRAFTARQGMALAAANCETSLATIEAKDIMDSLYLGLDCEVMDCGEFCEASSTVDEFVDYCKTMLQELSDADDAVTISLPNNTNLNLNEKNGHIQMSMDGKQVTLPNLTIHHLYKNLVQDIQNNPDLYGTCLTGYVNSLQRREKICALLLPAH